MEVIDKNLNYFWQFMPHEEGKDASPSQITEVGDILLQMGAIVEYLNANYGELEEKKVVYHYYKTKDRLLGLEIVLDNPEDILVGTIRIYHRGCENTSYYTFQTNVETQGDTNNHLKKARSNLYRTLKSLGLRKLPHSEVKSPILYRRFAGVNLRAFRGFYGALRELSRNLCLKTI